MGTLQTSREQGRDLAIRRVRFAGLALLKVRIAKSRPGAGPAARHRQTFS